MEQLKQSAKRKKGRGFATAEHSGDSRGTYDTLKGDGPGPQRSIDVGIFLVASDRLNSGLDYLRHRHQRGSD